MDKKESPKVIFISSPFRPVSKDPARAAEELADNIRLAKLACEMVTLFGTMPLAPHLYFPQFLDDDCPKDRATGLRLGLEWVELSDELWVFGNRVSDCMAAEIARAKKMGIPVRNIPDPRETIEMLMVRIMRKAKESEDKTHG